MLSRIADSLFWMARYMDRAENTARLLDVTYHMLPGAIASDIRIAVGCGDPDYRRPGVVRTSV